MLQYLISMLLTFFTYENRKTNLNSQSADLKFCGLSLCETLNYFQHCKLNQSVIVTTLNPKLFNENSFSRFGSSEFQWETNAGGCKKFSILVLGRWP